MHDYPLKFWENLVHVGCLKNIQDITIGNGLLAFVCARGGLGYFGFGCSKEHCNAVNERVEDVILNELRQSSSQHFKPAYAKAVGETDTASAQVDSKTSQGKEKATKTTDTKPKPETDPDPTPEPSGKPGGGNAALENLLNLARLKVAGAQEGDSELG